MHLLHISCEGNIQDGIRCIAPPLPFPVSPPPPPKKKSGIYDTLSLCPSSFCIYDPLPLCMSSVWVYILVPCFPVRQSVCLLPKFVYPQFRVYDILPLCASVCVSSWYMYKCPSVLCVGIYDTLISFWASVHLSCVYDTLHLCLSVRLSSVYMIPCLYVYLSVCPLCI